MKRKRLLLKIAISAIILLFLLSLAAPVIFPQPQMATPRQEKLLNGLKVLMFPEPKADLVSLKLRVHSGSAFDPQGKEGVMRLLASNIFPNPETREFFKEELGGDLSVESNYDYIQVNASAKPDQLLAMLETVASAVSNITIDKETTAKLKVAQTGRLEELSRDATYQADRAAAARLFGTFPYGRPEDGTAASISKIDFADLIDARQRFLTADNATVALAGRFDQNLAFRALRRYFGAWLKADRLVPSTFRQPDEPAGDVQTVIFPVEGADEIRLVTRGSARGGPDAAAFAILARILESRLRSVAYGVPRVRSFEHMLPGIFVISVSSAKDTSQAKSLVTKLFSAPVTEAEFSPAKQAYIAERESTSVIDGWMDVDTFKTEIPSKAQAKAAGVTLADVERVLSRLQKQPFATVILTSTKPAN